MRIFPSIRIERRFEQFNTKRAKFLLVGNQNNADFLLRLGVSPSKIRILPVVFNLNPIHHAPPSTRSKILVKDLGLERFQTILCISRLESLKLVDHVIRAVPFMGSDISRIRVLIVGDGPESEKLKELSRSINVEGSIVFFGNKDQEWLSQIIAATDVFVSPLAGRALAEAALGGAAVVAYDIDWHSELVEDKVSGVLVPYLDYEALGKSVGILLEDSRYRQELGKSIREKMQQKLESFDNASSLHDLYAKSLSNID
jgi:glycosyltransferase involved in cell wall biosynthesis